MVPSPALDKKKYETTWANASVAEADKDIWKNFHSTNRIYLSNGKKLALWRHVDKRAALIDVLEILTVSADIEFGISVKMKVNEREFNITHTPALLPNANAFLWVPYFFDLRWAPYNFDVFHDRKSLTFPLCVKTLNNPKQQLINGADYVTELAEFQRDWPTLKTL